MGTDCKSAAFSFGGSNPPAPTKNSSIRTGYWSFCFICYTKGTQGWIRTAPTRRAADALGIIYKFTAKYLRRCRINISYPLRYHKSIGLLLSGGITCTLACWFDLLVVVLSLFAAGSYFFAGQGQTWKFTRKSTITLRLPAMQRAGSSLSFARHRLCLHAL